MTGSVVQITVVVFGACGGPLAGLFFLGGMIPKANWKGAIIGIVTSLAFTIWITIGAQLYGKRPVKLTQNPTSGCFPGNQTVTIDEPSMYSYNDTTTSSLYDVTGNPSVSPNNPIKSDDSFFLYNVSYVWYGFIGFFLTLIIGTVVSLCTGGDCRKPVKANLIFPVCRKLFGLKSRSQYEVAAMEDKILPLPKT
ncbi:sodium-coupled monocarboxylate transporter 2-like [Pecten maximus]|uniref:sodium-coupled monocarboxylate transporter 2-like n=1 Tax=Pecten maximus TaxID=6579 RepID=UPI001457F799|nr:sodium-coupled monocarboxylate transporter 2-like [Pecten maximus]